MQSWFFKLIPQLNIGIAVFLWNVNVENKFNQISLFYQRTFFRNAKPEIKEKKPNSKFFSREACEELNSKLNSKFLDICLEIKTFQNLFSVLYYNMNTNLLDLDNDILSIIGDYVKKDNDVNTDHHINYLRENNELNLPNAVSSNALI